jgi:hypothetical protein
MCNEQGQIVKILCGSRKLHDSAFRCVVENVEDEKAVLATAVSRLGTVILRIPKSTNGPLA